MSSTPDTLDGLRRVAITVVGFTAGFALIAVRGPIATVAAVVILSFMYAGLIYAEHEFLHHSVFQHPWINDALGLAAGTVVMAPYGGHRAYHFQHHARTHMEGDAEPIVVLRSVWAWIGAMVAGVHGLRYDAFKWTPNGLTSRNRRSRALTYLSLATLALSLAFGAFLAVEHTRLLVLGWLLPTIIGAPIGTFLTFSDHYGCDYGPADPFATTRTIPGTRVTRFLTWNSNYHAEHHWAPSVPTAHLGDFHELAKEYLKYPESSYLAFHRGVLAGIRRKEWPETPPWRAAAPDPATVD